MVNFMQLSNVGNRGFGEVPIPKQFPQCQYVGANDLRCQTKEPGVLRGFCEKHRQGRETGEAPTAVVTGLRTVSKSSDYGTGSGNPDGGSTDSAVLIDDSTSVAKRKASVSGFTKLWESYAKQAKVVSGNDLKTEVARESRWSNGGKQMYRHVYQCFPGSNKPDSEEVAAVYDKCITSKLPFKKNAGKPYPFGGRGEHVQLEVRAVINVTLRGDMPVKVQHLQHWFQMVDTDTEDVKRELESVLRNVQSESLVVISEDKSIESVVQKSCNRNK